MISAVVQVCSMTEKSRVDTAVSIMERATVGPWLRVLRGFNCYDLCRTMDKTTTAA